MLILGNPLPGFVLVTFDPFLPRNSSPWSITAFWRTCFDFSKHRRSKPKISLPTTLPPTTTVLVGKWYVSKMSFKKGKFSTEPYWTGRKDKTSRIELVGVPYFVSQKEPCWIMLNIKPQHHSSKKKSRILFYVHASMPPLRKPKQKMAARMNLWKMMMFHHEILNWKREVHCLSFWPFIVFISFHIGVLDLHFLSDVKRTFCWEMFSCFFEVDQRRSC